MKKYLPHHQISWQKISIVVIILWLIFLTARPYIKEKIRIYKAPQQSEEFLRNYEKQKKEAQERQEEAKKKLEPFKKQIERVIFEKYPYLIRCEIIFNKSNQVERIKLTTDDNLPENFYGVPIAKDILQKVILIAEDFNLREKNKCYGWEVWIIDSNGEMLAPERETCKN